jgi:hypothetical protein
MDADGQHPPEDARRIVARLGEYDLVVGARTPATHATAARGAGNALLNRLASYLTGRPIPDLTSGFRGARTTCLREFIHLLPNGFSTPTTTTLAFIKAGYNVAFEPVAQRVRSLEDQFARDGARFMLILLKIAPCSACCGSSCRQRARQGRPTEVEPGHDGQDPNGRHPTLCRARLSLGLISNR